MTDYTPEQEAFWRTYLATLPPGEPHPPRPEAWYFCDSEDCANALGALVVAGLKTATASLHAVYEAEGERLPRVGDLSLITDWNGRPLAVTEVTDIQIRPFDQVDPQHAYDEGEGDRSLAYWREVHWRAFGRECAALGIAPGDGMLVVLERFRVLFRGA